MSKSTVKYCVWCKAQIRHWRRLAAAKVPGGRHMCWSCKKHLKKMFEEQVRLKREAYEKGSET